MANFFKEYHAELRAKRQAEAEQESKARNEERERNEYIDGLKVGQKVRYSFLIDTATKNPIVYSGYFCGDAGEHIWISETKQEAKDGYGRTISKSSIIL